MKDFIDFSLEYKVEPKLAIGDPIGLAREGLSRNVGTVKTYCVAFNDQTKKYKTGLDEFAPEVQTLPEKEKEERIAWIKQTKESLETALGEKGILDPKNEDFWSIYQVTFEVTQDKKITVMGSHPRFLPNQFPLHKLALVTLRVGGEIPFSKKEATHPRFKHAQFYITTPEEINTLTKEKNKKTRKRFVEFEKLFPSEGGKGDFERAWNIAYLLGVQKETNISYDKLEELMDIFSVQPEYIDRFLELCALENSELEVEKVIKKACEYGVIAFRPEDKLYYRGGHNFRSTEAETTKYFKVNMADPSIAREFIEIKALVDKRLAKAKK